MPRVYKQVKRGIKKRYQTRTGGVRIKRLVKDINFIKSSLNSERKHLQVMFGGAGGAAFTRKVVTKGSPIVQEITPLSSLAQGVTGSTRIGDNIKLTSISYKGSMMLDNLNNKSQTTRAIFYLIQMKDADNALTIQELFETDQNGDRSVNSYWVEEHYGKYNVLAKHEFNLRQYLPSTSGSAPANRVTQYFDNHIIFDESRRVMLKYDGSTLETNSLYVVCITDSILDSDNDKLQFDLNMKINFVDN